MNYLSQMKKFLKKNYKKIIIVCLIMILLSKKMYENFDLDVVKAIETKFNNVFTKLEDDEVTIDKNLRVKQLVSERLCIGRTCIGEDQLKVLTEKLVSGESLCIGETCIGEDQLKVLTGKKYFSLQSGRTNKRLKDNEKNGSFDEKNDIPATSMAIKAIRDKDERFASGEYNAENETKAAKEKIIENSILRGSGVG
jgi:hypothetical protein